MIAECILLHISVFPGPGSNGAVRRCLDGKDCGDTASVAARPVLENRSASTTLSARLRMNESGQGCLPG